MDEETPPLWPIKELARRVAAALAVGYDGPGNARVRGVPDVRSIRWYATIGLLDKPSAYRGRVALYGPRHLRQVVAVKRCQAAGAKLADIQAELAGASPQRLDRLARVPAALLDGTGLDGTEFNGAGEISDSAALSLHDENGEQPSQCQRDGDAAFWKSAPVAVATSHASTGDLSYGIRLADGITILIEASHQPSQADFQAVRAAAQPLLHVAKARGLFDTGATS